VGRFDRQINTASRLIQKNGQPVTVRGIAPTAGPTPWRPGPPSVSDQVGISAVFLDYQQKYIDGEVIRMGDQQVLLPALGLSAPPEVDGYILRGAEKWKILVVKPLNPNGQTILFELQVRQ
jgi:hypothetical protein